MNRTDVVPEVLWAPTPQRVARAAITDFSGFVSAPDRPGTGRFRFAVGVLHHDLGAFWSAVADYFGVRWHQPPTTALPAAVMPGADWFPGGTLNYAEHALAGVDRGGAWRPGGDRDCRGRQRNRCSPLRSCGQRWVPRRPVSASSGSVQATGLSRWCRTRVEALVAFLATAALGAVWSSCSPDFGAPSVIDRFTQISPTVLIAVDGYRYGGRRSASRTR